VWAGRRLRRGGCSTPAGGPRSLRVAARPARTGRRAARMLRTEKVVAVAVMVWLMGLATIGPVAGAGGGQSGGSRGTRGGSTPSAGASSTRSGSRSAAPTAQPPSMAVPGQPRAGGLLTPRQPCDVKGVGGVRGFRGFGPARFEGPAFVIIDATPLDAQVFLNGRLLGSARDLVARAFAVQAGRHAVEIIAPGFRPYIAQLAVDPSFPTRLRVALPPE